VGLGRSKFFKRVNLAKNEPSQSSEGVLMVENKDFPQKPYLFVLVDFALCIDEPLLVS
jgi:hypothetical protein